MSVDIDEVKGRVLKFNIDGSGKSKNPTKRLKAPPWIGGKARECAVLEA